MLEGCLKRQSESSAGLTLSYSSALTWHSWLRRMAFPINYYSRVVKKKTTRKAALWLNLREGIFNHHPHVLHCKLNYFTNSLGVPNALQGDCLSPTNAPPTEARAKFEPRVFLFSGAPLGLKC